MNEKEIREAIDEAENIVGSVLFYENDKPEYVNAIKCLQNLAESVLNAKMPEMDKNNYFCRCVNSVENEHYAVCQSCGKVLRKFNAVQIYADEYKLIIARDYISKEEHEKEVEILIAYKVNCIQSHIDLKFAEELQNKIDGLQKDYIHKDKLLSDDVLSIIQDCLESNCMDSLLCINHDLKPDFIKATQYIYNAIYQAQQDK
jgi:hypothetical protein